MNLADSSKFNWRTVRASVVVLVLISMAAYVCAEDERSRQRRDAQNVQIATDAMAKAIHEHVYQHQHIYSDGRSVKQTLKPPSHTRSPHTDSPSHLAD